MNSSPQRDRSQAVLALIEYHNRSTALGWFRKIDRPGFYLQQLPLTDVEFAILMSDFFMTFGVSAEHYDETRYFPARRPSIRQRMGRLAGGTAPTYRPLTVAMLCEAARQGCWPQARY